MKGKHLLIALVIAGMICGVVGYIGYTLLRAPSEKSFHSLSEADKQRLVDAVCSRLEDHGLLDEIVGFGYTKDGFEILFKKKFDPQAISIVREVIEELPLNVIENATCETITPPPIHWHLMLRRVFLWENGEERFVAGPNSDLCNYLLQTFHKVNLQGRCVFSEERIQKIKENDKVIVLSFRFTEDFAISQWIESKDRDHIKTDENGYRILEQVRKALFILEDNLDEGLQGLILVYSETEGWSCWAIRLESGELDKTWIGETNKLLSELQG